MRLKGLFALSRQPRLVRGVRRSIQIGIPPSRPNISLDLGRILKSLYSYINMHHHMSRQSKARRNIIPQCHLTETQQNTDCYDHHHLCHVQQPTPCSRDHHLHLNNTDIDTVKHRAYHLRQAPSTKETIHCYFCPNFQGQGPRLRM